MSAPENYAEIFKLYYPYIVNLCSRFGIDDNNKEDVASEIFLRFMERGSLEKFDPELSFEYRGRLRPARFKNYLSRAVDMYSRGHRDKLAKLARRELQICDVDYSINAKDGSGYQSSADSSWVEVFGESHDDHADRILDMMGEESEAAGIRVLLAKVKPRSAHDRCDLVALFDAVRIQVLTFGEYDIAILKDHFGVSTTAMHTWVWWLKANLADIYGMPVPAKRPRRMRQAES
jgi:hypothetical protein